MPHLFTQTHRITTKIQNNHHSEPSEIELNGSLTTIELKKPHPSKLVEGAQMQNRLVPYSYVLEKNSGGISWEQGVPAQHQAPQHRVLVPGRKVPTTSGCKNPAGIELVEETSEAPRCSS